MTASRHASPRRALRQATGLLVLVVAAAVLLVGAPSPASAHDGLVGTSPVEATTLTSAPASVELEFTGEPLPLGTLVTVSGPGGTTVSDGPAEILGTKVVQRLAGNLGTGTYRVDWRSTSSDGHALSGTFGFTVATGGAPSPSSSGLSPAASDATTTDSAIAPVWLVAGAVVLVGLGVVVATRVRRRA